MPKVLITTSQFDVAGNAELNALTAAGYEIVTNLHGRRLTEDEGAGLIAAHRPVGMIAGVEPLTRRCLDAGRPGLRVVSRCGTGLDSVDLAAAREFGIAVLNTPDAPARSVAELTFGLILGTLRRIGEADRAIRAGRWQALMGDLLHGRTLGVMGYGRVGRMVGDFGLAFGAHVLACDPAVEVPPAVERVELPALLARSDVLTLHLTLGPDTRHLIDAAALARMKPGAILVNTARGGLVDEAALAEALRAGRLAGAALDVYEEEPYRGPLAAAGTALLTAHMGSYSRQTRAMQEAEAAENLRRALGVGGDGP